MKAININEVPKLMRKTQESKWDFVSKTLLDGKVCVIEPSDYKSYKHESAIRSSISAHMRSRGVKYSIRKDASTGNFYVIPKPTEPWDESHPS